MIVADEMRILFLAANPKDSSKLLLDQEFQDIHAKIRAAEARHIFDLLPRWAIRPNDLTQALNEVQPEIVHFSGHGSRTAELLLKDDGNRKPASEAALVNPFKIFKDNIRLVLLNACQSEAQARTVSQQVECTDGTSVATGDEAAIVFASLLPPVLDRAFRGES